MCQASLIKVTACAFACVIGEAVNADDFTKYKKMLTILSEPSPRPSVGLVAGGFGASAGAGFIGVSYTDRDEQTDGADNDGSMVVGIGVGDANASVGVELSVGLTSVSTSLWGDGNFADEGNLNVKLHREISLPSPVQRSSVAVGISNLAGWGAPKENPRNFYTALSALQLVGAYDQYGVMYTFGYGSAVSDAETSGNIFGGIGLGRGSYSVSTSFIGSDLHFTGNWYPSFYKNAVVSYTRSDFTNNSGLERNILSLGLSF